jgi:hypothetical protein
MGCPVGTLVGIVVISLNMHTMNWQHDYIHMHILSVATTGALTGPYGTNMAKDGHDTANSKTFLPQLLAVIYFPDQLLTNTHNEETANVNFL